MKHESESVLIFSLCRLILSQKKPLVFKIDSQTRRKKKGKSIKNKDAKTQSNAILY